MSGMCELNVRNGARLTAIAVVALLFGACSPPSYSEYAQPLPRTAEGGAGSSGAPDVPDAGGGAGLGGTGSGGAAGSVGTVINGDGGANDGGDAGASGAAGMGNVGATLVHRYSFSGEGTSVTDSVGGADGTVMNATLKGDGTLVLAGGTSDQYVDLPNGLVSSLGDATFEAWITWDGGDPWQRVFDFGSTSQGEGMQGTGLDYVFLTPSASDHHVHGTCRTASTNGEVIASSSSVPMGQELQIVLVVDDTHDMISLYWQGAFKTAVAFTGHLSEIHDFNDWLGRSEFGDSSFAGTFDEFRIYSTALTSEQIKASSDAGPNPSFLP